ncbi:MAG TPA: rhodanese-like domain-containing protein [Candidatus Aquilonibacter sp.]|nr:rhodanese-like domain-containing protein [Candidatus Aquilonibacter sp.]
MNDRIDARSLSHDPSLRIIDIRKAPDDRKIPGSQPFDGAEIESGQRIPFEKDERVVLYCGSGNSCTRIAGSLRERGYDVVALDGGYKAWVEAGLPTEPLAND